MAGKGVDSAWAPALLDRQLQRRARSDDLAQSAERTVRFAITDRYEIGSEGFELHIHDGQLDVLAQTDLGFVYAVGEILRRSRVDGGRVTLELELNPWLSRPIYPFRGVWVDPVADARFAGAPTS
jgi:hypothetical protein